nr:Gag-Pol polyprotein [Tanacetum cinerariifolium]
MYMAQIQKVTPYIADNFGPIFDTEPLQKVQNDDDNYNVFCDDQENPEQPASVNDPYLDMCYDRGQDDQDDTDELAQERDLLASLFEKLKCEINDNKNRNKFLETSNKTLVDKLKGEIEDFKTKNKSLESSNNHFKEASNEPSKTNQLIFKDLKKFQAELDGYHVVNYASKINDLNQTILDMKKEIFAHQKTISIMSQQKEAQFKYYKTRKDKEIDKVIALENKVKVLDNIVYKTGQSVQTINILNRCYNDNLALMLAPESDEVIHLEKKRVIPTTSVSRPQLKSNQLEDRFMPNNSQRKKQQVADHRRNFKFTNNKMFVTACNDSLNAKNSTVNFFCVTCGKYVLNDNHDMYVLHYMNGVNSRTKQLIVVSISTRDPKQTMNQSVATSFKKILVEIILFIVDSGCSKHMMGNLKLITNFVEKFLGTVKFGNDQIALILSYGDLVQGTITIKGFITSKGNDLLTGSRGTDLYSITLQDTSYPNPIFLMAKATSSQAWLWHRRLSHINFDTINLLSKYTWTHFLRSKDETPTILIDFVTLVQRGLHAQIRTIQTNKGMEFLNKTLHAYFAKEGIRHETSTALTPEQNGIVKRWNRTLVEAARIMLSAAKVPLFFWAEAIATACFTQNRSLVIPRHKQTPYHIINGRKPSVKFFYIFSSLCYIVRDGENLDKMKEKGDACIFIGYSTLSRAYKVFNKRTRIIVETIHVNFNEFPHMVSDRVSSDPIP